MKRFLIILTLLSLTSCAAWTEMGETGEPPQTLVNQYRASVRIVEQPRLTREIWNFVARKLHAATTVIDSDGIDLVIDDPVVEDE